MRNISNTKNLFISIISAFVIFIIGFGVIRTLWEILPKKSNLLGFYDYKAATLGDGLCLPILIGSLVYYVKNNNILRKKQLIFSFIFGSITALIGFLIQMSWLYDNNISTNWTIPYPHHFNIAGWYHAFFFTTMFGLLGILLCQMCIIRFSLRNADNTLCHSEKLAIFLIWFSGSFFLLLHILDDYKDKFNLFPLLLLSSLVILVFAIIIFWITKLKFIFEEILCIISGISTAFGFALTINFSKTKLELFALIGFFLAFAYIPHISDSFTVILIESCLITLPILSLNLALASMRYCSYMIPFLFFLIIIPFIIAQSQKRFQHNDTNSNEINKHILEGLLLEILTSVTIILLKIDISNYSSIINFILGLAEATIVKSSIEKNFELVKKTENSRKIITKESFEFIETKLKTIKTTSYFLIIMVGFGALLYLILTLSSYIKLKEFIFAKDFTIQNKYSVLFFISLTTSLILLYIIKNKSIEQNSIFLYKFAIIFLFTIAYIMLGINIYFLRSPYIIEIDFTNICMIFMVFGSSYMIAENFYSNLIGIRGIKSNIYIKICTGIIFSGNLFVITLSLLAPMNSQNCRSSELVYVLISTIGCLISTLLLPVLIGTIIRCKIPEVQIATTTPIGGIIQNGFLAFILIFLGGEIPIYFISICKKTSDMSQGIILLIHNIYWPLTYCMHNNVEHLSKRTEEFFSSINTLNRDDKKIISMQYNGLINHLRRQNIATFVALLFYSVISALIEIITYIHNNGSAKNFIQKYIPPKN